MISHLAAPSFLNLAVLTKGTMNDIRQIVYVSTAVPKLSDTQLDRFVTEWQNANAERGITGMVVYGDGSIMQVIEGQPDAVGALFDKIRNDPRHRGVIKMIDILAEERDFGAWTMACKSAPTLKPIGAMMDLDKHRAELYERFKSLGTVGEPLANMVERIARLA